jgi:hypothetical protein
MHQPGHSRSVADVMQPRSRDESLPVGGRKGLNEATRLRRHGSSMLPPAGQGIGQVLFDPRLRGRAVRASARRLPAARPATPSARGAAAGGRAGEAAPHLGGQFIETRGRCTSVAVAGAIAMFGRTRNVVVLAGRAGSGMARSPPGRRGGRLSGPESSRPPARWSARPSPGSSNDGVC